MRPCLGPVRRKRKEKKKREKKGDSCLRIASGVCAEISNVCSSAANYVDNKKKGGWDGMGNTQGVVRSN